MSAVRRRWPLAFRDFFSRIIGEVFGGRATVSKGVAADRYVYALVDYREVDRRPALARAFT